MDIFANISSRRRGEARSDRVARRQFLKRRLLTEVLEGRQLMATDLVDGQVTSFGLPSELQSTDLQSFDSLGRGEGVGEIVGLSLGVTDAAGNSILNGTTNQFQVNVGQQFNLQMFAEDLRPISEQFGVAAVYADFLAANQGKFRPVFGDVQRLQFGSNVTGGNYRLIFGSATTAQITVASGSNAATAIQNALAALPNVGAGNVVVRFNSGGFDIRFANLRALQDLPLLGINTTNITTNDGQPAQVTLVERRPTFVGETQEIRFSSNVSNVGTGTAGTYVVSFDGNSTAAIPLKIDNIGKPDDTSVDALQAALEQLPGIGAGNVLVESRYAADGTRRFAVTFLGSLIYTDVSLLSVDPSGLATNNGSAATAIVTQTAAFGQLNPLDLVPSMSFGPDFGANQRGRFGPDTINPQVVFDDAGALNPSTVFPADPSGPKFVLSIPIEAVATTGTGDRPTFRLDPADEPGRDILLYDRDSVVPSSLVDFGQTITGIFVQGLQAVDDNFQVTENQTNVVLDVLFNDIAPGSASKTVVNPVLIQPIYGSVQLGTNGANVRYTPPAGFTGKDIFVYTFRNAAGQTDTAAVTITVNPVNDPPVVVNDNVDATEDIALDIPSSNLLQNDSPGPGEENSQTIRITAVTNAASGATVQLIDNGNTVRYSPVKDFNGTDTFTYTVTDNLGASTVGTVTVTVAAVNDPPVANGDSLSTNEDTSITVKNELLSNDSKGADNEASQTLSIVAVNGSAQGGSVTLNNDGSVTYTPPAEYYGQDSFTYQISDGQDTSDFATVVVTIAPVNDAPTATDDPLTVDEGSSGNTLDVLSNDSPGPGPEAVDDSLKIIAVSTPTQGGTVQISGDRLSLIYTPPANFIGADTFTYTVEDEGGLRDVANVSVNVVPIARPRAINDNFPILEDAAAASYDVLSNDLPNLGEEATLEEILAVSGGTASIDTNNTPTDKTDDRLRFQPASDFNGIVTITYRISDTSGVVQDPDSAIGTVTFNVAAVNDAPIARDDTVETPGTEDNALQIPVSSLTSNDSPGPADEAGQTLSVKPAGTSAAGGTVQLVGSNVVYTPPKDFNGTDTFTYLVNDGQLDSLQPATVTVTVNAVNDDPIAAPHSVETIEDNSVTISIADDLLSTDRPGPDTAVDEANQTLSVVASTTSAKGGTIVQNGDDITYTPPDDLFGESIDSFTYILTDSEGGSTTGTVTITIIPFNDPPTAVDDTIRTFRDVELIIPAADLLDDDSPGPLESDELKIVEVRPVSSTVGTVELLGDGSVRYTPPAGYDGPDVFEYVISDGEFTDVALVTVTVEPFVPSTVTGMIYADENRNGIRDVKERGIGGIPVQLHGTSLLGEIDLVQFTLADGTYDFGSLPPGTYSVSYVTPEQYTDLPDTPGSLGDSDGIENSYTFTIDVPGGSQAENYDFLVRGLTRNYYRSFDRIAASKSRGKRYLLKEALYGVVGPNNEADWFAATRGYDGIRYAEILLSGDKKQAVVSVVTEDLRVLTATISSKRFVVLKTSDGRSAVRIMGGLTRHNFQEVDRLNPPPVPYPGYLDAIDRIFGQEGWDDEEE